MSIVAKCEELKKEGFDCLSSLTGMDRGENFEVVYHIFSYAKKETVVLKEKVERESPSIASVSGVWPSAIWMEREVFDLLGIDFKGHPDLRRIMLPDDWTGHPLRRDYSEAEEYAGMSTVR